MRAVVASLGGRSGGELAEGHRCSAAGVATRFALRRSSFQEHLGSAGVAQQVGGEAVMAMAGDPGSMRLGATSGASAGALGLSAEWMT
jgi:hypothetical protein